MATTGMRAPIIAFLLAACGAGEPVASGPTVRDSAGITIVENTAPAWREGDGWRVAERPELEIGVLDGDEVDQLYRVRDAVRLSDGRILIANAGTNELRYYDAAGRHLLSVGREGGGPGEFRGLYAIHRLPGDSVLASDGRARRLSLFDSDARFVTSYAGPPPIGRLGDGTLVRRAAVRTDGPPESGYVRQPVVLIRYTLAGDDLETIARLPGGDSFRLIERDDNVVALIHTPAPFGRVQQVAIAPDRAYAGAGDTFRIEVYDTAGRLARLVRRSQPNRQVTPAEIERYRARALENAPGENGRRRVERFLSEAPFPETMPAYGEFRVDADGNLWVEEYRAPGEDQPRWSVFDPDGRWLGDVETPPGLRITEIGEDYLVGIRTDELEVEHVALYRIEKPR